MKNRKGFTLTELLVAVVILGIIAGLSIPLIRNLSGEFQRRKYQTYADAVLVAAKLYNDSYSEDLFGHNEYGCAYITYDKLVEKKLIGDIEVEEMSCNSDMTYVRVTKQKDKYGYSPFISCGKKTRGKITKVTLSIPKVVPEMDSDSCTGVNMPNLKIEADPKEGLNAKNKYKTRIKISSGTGINRTTAIYAKWSKTWNDYLDVGFEKIDFKIEGNQEQILLGGNLVTTKSKELLTPEETGEYYLIVRVDKLEDLHGNKWVHPNPQRKESKYIEFGPYVVADNQVTGPIKLEIYNPSNERWVNKDIELEIKGSSKYEIDNYYETLDPNNSDSWKVISEGEGKTQFTKTYNMPGENKLYVKVCDVEGNCAQGNTDLRIDKNPPTVPIIENSSKGNWVKTDVTLKISSTDAETGISDYYYTYNPEATKKGTDPETEWVKLEGGTQQEKFTTQPWHIEQGEVLNKTAYIRAYDAAENYSEANTPIKIDKIPPTQPKITSSSGGSWAKSVTLTQTSSDEGSGIGKWYQSYTKTVKVDNFTNWTTTSGCNGKTTCKDTYTQQRNATTYIKVCDVAQNCSQISTASIKIDTTAPKCATTKKSGTSGVTATFSCSDSGGSGLKSSCETKKTGLKSSQTYKTIYDNAGNSATCKVSVSKKCTAYKCTNLTAHNILQPKYGSKYWPGGTKSKSACSSECNKEYKCPSGANTCYDWRQNIYYPNKCGGVFNNKKYLIYSQCAYETHNQQNSESNIVGEQNLIWRTKTEIKKYYDKCIPSYVTKISDGLTTASYGCCACCRSWSCTTYKYS